MAVHKVWPHDMCVSLTVLVLATVSSVAFCVLVYVMLLVKCISKIYITVIKCLTLFMVYMYTVKGTLYPCFD